VELSRFVQINSKHFYIKTLKNELKGLYNFKTKKFIDIPEEIFFYDDMYITAEIFQNNFTAVLSNQNSVVTYDLLTGSKKLASLGNGAKIIPLGKRGSQGEELSFADTLIGFDHYLFTAMDSYSSYFSYMYLTSIKPSSFYPAFGYDGSNFYFQLDTASENRFKLWNSQGGMTNTENFYKPRTSLTITHSEGSGHALVNHESYYTFSKYNFTTTELGPTTQEKLKYNVKLNSNESFAYCNKHRFSDSQEYPTFTFKIVQNEPFLSRYMFFDLKSGMYNELELNKVEDHEIFSEMIFSYGIQQMNNCSLSSKGILSWTGNTIAYLNFGQNKAIKIEAKYVNSIGALEILDGEKSLLVIGERNENGKTFLVFTVIKINNFQSGPSSFTHKKIVEIDITQKLNQYQNDLKQLKRYIADILSFYFLSNL
jgi:hypothetical protein